MFKMFMLQIKIIRETDRHILRGTNFSVLQQYPQAIVEQRRRLVPVMNDARGKKAYISYNKLYMDGALYEPQRETQTTTE